MSKSKAVPSREGWTQIMATPMRWDGAGLLLAATIFVKRMLASPMNFRFNHVHPLTKRNF